MDTQEFQKGGNPAAMNDERCGDANSRKAMSLAVGNGTTFPDDELRKYDGLWVAFSADGTRIVASGKTLAELEETLAAAGVNPEEVGFEQVIVDDEFVGGVELG